MCLLGYDAVPWMRGCSALEALEELHGFAGKGMEATHRYLWSRDCGWSAGTRSAMRNRSKKVREGWKTVIYAKAQRKENWMVARILPVRPGGCAYLGTDYKQV